MKFEGTWTQVQDTKRSRGPRPLSSASVERVFSHLTHTDVASRWCMGEDTLHDNLFLRGNARIIRHLLRQRADELDADNNLARPVHAALATDKRSRGRAAVATASSKLHTTKRARGGCGADATADVMDIV